VFATGGGVCCFRSVTLATSHIFGLIFTYNSLFLCL